MADLPSLEHYYNVRFENNQRGGHASPAAEIHGSAELMCLIPGSELSKSFRHSVIQSFIRVQGGDMRKDSSSRICRICRFHRQCLQFRRFRDHIFDNKDLETDIKD